VNLPASESSQETRDIRCSQSEGFAGLLDVQMVPGIVSPYVSGPAAENDAGQPLWTIPPVDA
jgi:hypothetical protein